ncbi:MAG: hypothetical protein ABI237_06000 [Ginsengibacter sp.]
MNQSNDDIKNYLSRTGQTYQELMAGEFSFGIQKITDLVIQANKENKKIVWQDDPELKLDSMSFTLQDT